MAEKPKSVASKVANKWGLKLPKTDSDRAPVKKRNAAPVKKGTPMPKAVPVQKSKIFDVASAIETLKGSVKTMNLYEEVKKPLEKSFSVKMDEDLIRHFVSMIEKMRPKDEIEFRFGTAGTGKYEPNKNKEIFDNLKYALSLVTDDNGKKIFTSDEYPTITRYLGESTKKFEGKVIKANYRGIMTDDGIAWEEKREAERHHSTVWGVVLTKSYENSKVNPGNVQIYRERVIRRTSYQCGYLSNYSHIFRIDLSEVDTYSVNGDKKKLIGTSYEIEVEVIHENIKKYWTSKKEFLQQRVRNDVSTFFVNIINWMYEDKPMTLIETQKVVSTINSFVRSSFGTKENEMKRSGMAEGFENKPVNLTPANFIFSTKPMYLIKKSDGVRCMLLATNDGIYKISPPYIIGKISDKVVNSTPILAEVEMSPNREDFEVFDCLIVGGQRLHKENFSKRISKFYEVYKDLSRALAEEGLNLSLKQFIPSDGLEPAWVDENDEVFIEEYQKTVFNSEFPSGNELNSFMMEVLRKKNLDSSVSIEDNKIAIAKLASLEFGFDLDLKDSEKVDDTVKTYLQLQRPKNVPSQESMKKWYFQIVKPYTLIQAFNQLKGEIESEPELYDGIIFQPDAPYASGYYPELNETYKWKPLSHLSIDFKPVVIEENPMKLELMCGKDQLFMGNEDYEYTKRVTIGKDVEESVKNELKRGAIAEFLWDSERKNFKFHRLRPDKKYPNSFKVAMSVWEEINEPFVPGETQTKNLVRLFHNKVKKDLLEKWSGGARELVDFGTGQGGDINKWRDLKFEKVLAVDPDHRGKKSASKEELLKRISGIKSGLKVYVADTGGEDTSAVMAAIKKYNMHPGLASAFFCLTFFSEEMVNDFAETLDSIIPDGGYFIGTVMDGTKVEDVLQEGEFSNELVTIKKVVEKPVPKPKTVKKKVETPTVRKPTKVRTTIADSRVDQEEFLFDFQNLRIKLEERHFDLVSTGMLDHTYSNIFYKLSKSEKEYSSLNRYFVFKKSLKVYKNELGSKKTTYSHLISNDEFKMSSIEQISERVAFMSAVYFAVDESYRKKVLNLAQVRKMLPDDKKSEESKNAKVAKDPKDIEKIKKSINSFHLEAAKYLAGRLESISIDDQLGEWFAESKYGKAKINGKYLLGYDYDDAKDLALREYIDFLLGKKSKVEGVPVDHSLTAITDRSLIEVLSEFINYNIIVVNESGSYFADYKPKYSADRPTVIVYTADRLSEYTPLEYEGSYVIPTKIDFIQAVAFGKIIEPETINKKSKVGKREKIIVEEEDGEDVFGEEFEEPDYEDEEAEEPEYD